MSEKKLSPGILLNSQSGKITWPELVRHFARGVVVCVNQEEDLVEMAARMVADRSAEISELIDSGRLHRANDKDAIRWQERQPEFWAVVVAPWVLVQEI